MRKFTFGAIAVLLSGCSTINYYNSATCEDEVCWAEDVKLRLNTNTPSDSTRLRFSSLSPQAQAALLANATPEQRTVLLSNGLFSRANGNIDRSRVRVSRDFQVSIADPITMHPANRVQAAEVSIKMPSQWRVTRISNFTDVNALISLGTIAKVQSASITGGLDDGLPLGGSLSATGTQSETATQQIARSITSTQYTFQNDEVLIFVRAPVPQTTVNRTYTFRANVEYSGEWLGTTSSIFTYEDDKATLNQAILVYPKNVGAVSNNIQATGDYLFRKVYRSDQNNLNSDSVRSIEEGDDDVEFKNKSFSGDTSELIGANTDAWTYLEYTDNARASQKVRIAPINGQIGQCVLMQSDAAHRFDKWLKDKKSATGDNWKLISEDGTSLNANQIASIKLRPLMTGLSQWEKQPDKCSFTFTK